MPSTRLLNVKIKSLPCFEKDGMIWVWPGNEPPTAMLPSLLPPSGFEIHAEVFLDYINPLYVSRTEKKQNYDEVFFCKVLSSYVVTLCMLQIVIELPVEHGLLLDNLLDLAHAPFTHTSTFAKGWSVPRLVFFKFHFIYFDVLMVRVK